ncbi:hypothetical protein HHA02_26950 [Cobetia marina]|nr:hypothetical protein HHA02_26950 [Cobetia marina]
MAHMVIGLGQEGAIFRQGDLAIQCTGHQRTGQQLLAFRGRGSYQLTVEPIRPAIVGGDASSRGSRSLSSDFASIRLPIDRLV